MHSIGTQGIIQAGAYKGKQGKVSRVEGYQVTLNDGKTVVGPFWNQSSFKADPITKWGCNALSSYENTGFDTSLHRAKALGINWDRPYAQDLTDIAWWVDTITRVNAAGLRPLVCLERRPYGTDFPDLAAKLVAALKPLGVTYYEILNEPELAGVTPDNYATLFRDTVVACRLVDPNAKFIAASAPDIQVAGVWTPWPTAVQKAVPNIGTYMDGWACHPYGSINSNSHSWGGGWNLLQYERNLWLASGIDKPCWITEVGMKLGASGPSSGSEDERVERLRFYVNQVKQTPWIEAFFWFQWGDYGTDNQWGLVESRNAALRKVGQEYSNLIK